MKTEAQKLRRAAYMAEYRKDNPKVRQQGTEAMRRYRAKNPEKALASSLEANAKRRAAHGYKAPAKAHKAQPVVLAQVPRDYTRPENSTLAERFAAWRKTG